MTRADRVILFHPDLIPLIRSGRETLTYRLDDDGLDYVAEGEGGTVNGCLSCLTSGLYARGVNGDDRTEAAKRING